MKTENASTQTTGWQPIETAPRDGQRIILWNGEISVIAHFLRDGGAFAGTMSGSEGRVGYTGWYGDQLFTHWMPAPEPPEDVHGR